MKEFDYIIVGGGCAGLSLAYELEIDEKLRNKTPHNRNGCRKGVNLNSSEKILTKKYIFGQNLGSRSTLILRSWVRTWSFLKGAHMRISCRKG